MKKILKTNGGFRKWANKSKGEGRRERQGRGEGMIYLFFFACCYQGILKMILTLNPLSSD